MSLKDKAKKAVGGCELIAGLEKIENDLLIATYPQGITVTGADLLTTKDENTGEDKQFCVFTFAEDAKRYCSGGKILTDMFRDLMADYPDTDQFNAALRQEGGLKVKLEKKKGKNGNKYTSVTILD